MVGWGWGMLGKVCVWGGGGGGGGGTAWGVYSHMHADNAALDTDWAGPLASEGAACGCLSWK